MKCASCDNELTQRERRTKFAYRLCKACFLFKHQDNACSECRAVPALGNPIEGWRYHTKSQTLRCPACGKGPGRVKDNLGAELRYVEVGKLERFGCAICVPWRSLDHVDFILAEPEKYRWAPPVARILSRRSGRYTMFCLRCYVRTGRDIGTMMAFVKGRLGMHKMNFRHYSNVPSSLETVYDVEDENDKILTQFNALPILDASHITFEAMLAPPKMFTYRTSPIDAESFGPPYKPVSYTTASGVVIGRWEPGYEEANEWHKITRAIGSRDKAEAFFRLLYDDPNPYLTEHEPNDHHG